MSLLPSDLRSLYVKLLILVAAMLLQVIRGCFLIAASESQHKFVDT